MSPARQILFDHSIRPREKLRRYRKALLLSRLQVDDQLKLCRLLNRKVTGLRALEDLVYVSGCSAEQILKIRAVGHEPTFFHKSTPMVNRR